MNELSKDFEKKYEKEMAAEFASLKSTIKDKSVADALQKEYDGTKGISGMQIEEVNKISGEEKSATIEEIDDDKKDLEDDDEAPDLEEVDLE